MEMENHPEKPNPYFEHPGKVVESDKRFEHVMAITLDPVSQFSRGVIRCIDKREGDITIHHVDHSSLYTVLGNFPDHFAVANKLNIKDDGSVLGELLRGGDDFLGLEDPDIWRDPKTGLLHLYFTIPFRTKDKNDHYKIFLGHAEGEDLDSLRMSEPVLRDADITAKELSIAPVNRNGVRLNLFESSDRTNGKWYSTVRLAVAKDMGGAWEFGETIFHPKDTGFAWISGHASPGPFMSKDFIDVGDGKLAGFINGRGRRESESAKQAMFSVGLFIYDYENGKIDWVSPEPFILDSEAKTITFASQFVEQGEGQGILYAHVDDSFVRAYSIDAAKIKKLLKEL